MNFSDGVKAFKAERQYLVRRLRQVEKIIAASNSLSTGRKQKDETKPATKAKKVRKPRKFTKASEVPETMRHPLAAGA